MKLIIELKDETYKFYKENALILIARGNGRILASEVYEAIKNGKPYDEADRWIPVSERLPEKKGWYEATFISVTGARTVGLAFYSDRVEDFAVDGVIAWKPLPEPYKENDK